MTILWSVLVLCISLPPFIHMHLSRRSTSFDYFVVNSKFVSIITSISSTCILAGGVHPLTILWSVLVLCISLPPFIHMHLSRRSTSFDYFVVNSSFVYIVTSFIHMHLSRRSTSFDYFVVNSSFVYIITAIYPHAS